MYSNKRNCNNGEPSSDICRLRSRPGFQILSIIIFILVTVSCLLTIKPCDAAAADASMDTQESPADQLERDASLVALLTALEQEYLSQTITVEAGTAQGNTVQTGTEQDTATTETSEDDAAPFVYNSNIPLDSDIQQYLYDLCVQRNLDYKMCLAMIKHESGFNAKALGGGSNYGLFQINKCNHKSLSSALNTENKPFDAKTNINWGTYILSCLFEKYSSSYSDEDLLKAVLSAYNRGEGGFAKYGFAKSYIKEYYEALEVVTSWFE
jgi:hypothetical protein